MRTLRLVLAAGALAFAPAIARSQSAKPDTGKVDVTGKWNFNIETPVQGTPVVTFTQKGDSVKGEYISQALGTHAFVGVVKGRTILFSFPAESGGQRFDMAFTAKVDNADSMSGTIDFSGMATDVHRQESEALKVRWAGRGLGTRECSSVENSGSSCRRCRS